jgi:hypothetical protein
LVVFVNTKIWYRKESDLSVQPGEKIRPGKGRFLQKDSAKEPAVGNLLPFGKETVCADLWDCVMTWPERKGRMDG